MTAALQPQPAACASCGSPFVQPFCAHVLTALAVLTADPRELRSLEDHFADVEPLVAAQLLEEVDAIAAAEDPDTNSFSRNDFGRYCTVFLPWEPGRGRTRRRAS